LIHINSHRFVMSVSGGSWTVMATDLVQGAVVWFIPAMVARFFWCFRSRPPQAFRIKETAFFERMTMPVDFDSEIGNANDGAQALLIGRIVTGVGGLITLFLLVPNTSGDRGIILALAGFILCIGLILLLSARKNLLSRN